jgi:metallo-beta-lactamase class B
MKSYAIGLLSAVGLAAGLGGASAIGQTGRDTVEAHVAAAKAAAGQEHTALFDLCDAPAPTPAPVPTPQAGQPPAAQPKPKRDMVATHGQLTFGDTTLTFYLTPDHTLGTISTLIPVKDGGRTHLAAEWGGTGFNWIRNRTAYITPDRSDRFWFETHSNSAQRFRDIVTKAGADALIANHTRLDGSKAKLPALATRRPGDPHPYVIGNDSVRRYLTVANECAKAGLLRLD